MKISFKVTSYYAKNKKISKLHGTLFMIAGFIILVFISYGLYQLNTNFGSISEDRISGDHSSDSGYYVDVDCSNISTTTGRMNLASSFFIGEESEYESAKSKYYSTSNIDLKLESYEQWEESYRSLISKFNGMIFAYNEDSLYFDYCYNYSAWEDIETKRAFLDSEEIIIDTEYEKLKPEAEAEGYIFYE
ncbi:MAG: hypothetical protein ABH879_03585 [archaeon]